jgi:ribosome recycling factor
MSIEERMEKAIEATRREWAKIRTGVATPALLDGVSIEYFGAQTPISHVASIKAPEPRTLAIAPWEKDMLGEIEKAILASNLGLNPSNDGSIIRLVLPVLTQERRVELSKKVRKVSEEGKIAVRNIRRDENDKFKKEAKELGISEDEIKGELEEIQKITDGFVKNIDDLSAAKEADIMTV